MRVMLIDKAGNHKTKYRVAQMLKTDSERWTWEAMLAKCYEQQNQSEMPQLGTDATKITITPG